MQIADFDKLPMPELSDIERDKILIRLDPLIQYLGAPGDWGYDTKLGVMTVKLIEMRSAIRAKAA